MSSTRIAIAGLGAILTGVVAVSGPGRVSALGQQHGSQAEAISFTRDLDRQGGEGPVATAAQEQYDNRAYPNTTIGFEQVIASQQAVLFYFYSPALIALRAHLLECGVKVSPITYPDYMPKGEIRVDDPDGYCLLIGQAG